MLFVTCLTDSVFLQTGIATVGVLERLGHEVDFPQGQTCCGQLHFNTGYQKEALELARRFIGVFSEAEVVVAPSASCVAMVRDFYPFLAEQEGDAVFATDVSALTPRVLELTEFLARTGVEDVGAAFPQRVTYHPTCHSLRALCLGDAPSRLLRAVRGLELVELPRAEECCGFGGTFSVKNEATSVAMLEDKVKAVLGSRAEVVAAVDTSCLMQIGGALSRQRAGVRTMHIAEILAATA
jgi:L-lactate dehydrogenase complex protein LldE